MSLEPIRADSITFLRTANLILHLEQPALLNTFIRQPKKQIATISLSYSNLERSHCERSFIDTHKAVSTQMGGLLHAISH